MKLVTGTVAVLLLLAAAAWAVPSLTVAYHRDDHAAPLFNACLYPEDFQARYGLYLEEVKPHQLYNILDDKGDTMSLRLAAYDTDTEVMAALLSDTVQLGILAAEDVLGIILAGRALRIIAPLQYARDLLLVNPKVPAANWKEFIAWVKKLDRPATIGYIGQYSMAALGLSQALEYEKIDYVGTLPGKDLSPKPESTKVKFSRADDRTALAAELASGRSDAAVLEEPAATWISSLRGCPTIDRTDALPPGRLEDHPGTVIAATDQVISRRGEDMGRFLELMAVATHYTNNNTQKTLAAVNQWLGASATRESVSLGNMGFSSSPDTKFTKGIWNWYFALKLRTAVPHTVRMPLEMQEKNWLETAYHSLLLTPALDRAGARIIR